MISLYQKYRRFLIRYKVPVSSLILFFLRDESPSYVNSSPVSSLFVLFILHIIQNPFLVFTFPSQFLLFISDLPFTIYSHYFKFIPLVSSVMTFFFKKHFSTSLFSFKGPFHLSLVFSGERFRVDSRVSFHSSGHKDLVSPTSPLIILYYFSLLMFFFSGYSYIP